MTNVPLSYLPGVTKTVSSYASSKDTGSQDGHAGYGRFIDMDGVRFAGGYPEKLAGCALLTSTILSGIPRGLRDWRDFNQIVYLGIGTNAKLYYYADNQIHDITPLRAIVNGVLTNALTTTLSSNTVTVAHVAHGQQVGDYVTLTASTAVGGILIAGVYRVITVPTADSYTIQSVSTATSAATGGGTITYVYDRKNLTNPFSTVNGSSTVTVFDTNHGAAVGDYVTFSGASAVGGLTLNNEYVILSNDANSYTIDAGTPATATAIGGGTVSVIYDITSGLVDSAIAFGYGTGGYGENGYGTMGSTGVVLNARTWTLSKYGQQLLANPYGGTIYVWDPIQAGRAYPLYGAPPAVYGMFVTPERFVVALGGINGNPMQIAWADQNDYTNWISTPTNTANSGRTLQEGARMIAGVSTRNGINMIFSDTAAYNMNYTGDNNVYETLVAGKKCGLIGPLALTEAADIVYWMSDKDFWQWNGSVSKLPSDDIRDYVYDNINLTQAAKFVCGTTTARNEIFFMYCSANATENDRWVKWHPDQNCWSKGTVMTRTSWVDKELFPYPIGTDATGRIYNHEIGTDDYSTTSNAASALNSYIEFAPFDISNGDSKMDVFGFVPDFVMLLGAMTLTVESKDYPQSSTITDGPYTILNDGTTPIIDLRSDGRLIGYKLQSDVLGGDWRLGLPSVNIQPAGARR